MPPDTRPGGSFRKWVKTDEFCIIENEEMCIKNEELCI